MLDQYTKDENELNDKESTEPQRTEEVNTSETLDKDKAQEIPKNEPEEKDYSSFSLAELIKEIKELTSNFEPQQIKRQMNEIKSSFNGQFSELLAEKKEAFLADGGESIDFKFTSPLKTEFNKLMGEHKKKLSAYFNSLEKELKENLERRLQVIEELKELIENAEPATMYNKFRAIQNKWKSIGPVPKTKYNDTWKTYHFHVDRFYDLLDLSKDLREIDFKNNLEEKIQIIEKAESLRNEEDIIQASKELQELHRKWKEDIGPVAKELRDDIWERFSAATKIIHDRRHEYYKELKQKEHVIVEEKLKVIEAIRNFDTSTVKSHKDWQNSIKKIESLRKQYFDAGKLPYHKSEEVWQKFKKATKAFNTEKNNFYKQEKRKQQENLKKKMDLVEMAESLQNSTDWETTTETLKKIQSDWKKIGHVPRKFSDEIWKRFKKACNHYFDRYYEQRNSVSADQQKIVDGKKKIIDTLKDAKKLSKSKVVDLVNEWGDLGQLPRSVRHLEGKFNKQLEKIVDDSGIDKVEVEMIKFKNTVDAYAAADDFRKLDSEQLFVRRKIDEITKEIQQLENNLSFISNASDDNPLVQNVMTSISDFKEDLEIWQEKLKYIQSIS